jgi:pimeloyl-ACP methyl ester carboxylesterase
MSQLTLPDKSTTVRSIFSGFQQLFPSLAASFAVSAMFRTQRGRVADWERRHLAEAETLRIEGPSGTLVARRWGECGPLVLLVHGWNGRGTQLGAFVAPLVASGHQVVAFDAPGHGESAGSTSSMIQFANAFDAVLDTVRPFFQPLRGVIAHSMGGPSVTFALSRARARGRALHEAVEDPRLVFIAPPTDVRDFVDTVSHQLGLLPATQARLEGLLERRIGMSLDELHTLKLAENMSQPLLVVHDEQDRAVPFTSGQSLAGAWPGATLHVTRGLGHNRILRDPQVIAKVTDFVRGTSNN